MRWFLLLMLALGLVGCPSSRDDDDEAPGDDDDVLADDDDGAGDDDDATPHELGPAITGVEVCILENTPGWCAPPGIVARFSVTATDPDCDLNNPTYAIVMEGSAPVEGVFEGNMDCGGTLQIDVCSQYVSGYDMPLEVWLVDAAGHRGGSWTGSWLIPDEGDCGL